MKMAARFMSFLMRWNYLSKSIDVRPRVHQCTRAMAAAKRGKRETKCEQYALPNLQMRG